MSGLKLGTEITKKLPFSETVNPRDSKIDFYFSFETSTPPNDLVLCLLNSIVFCLFSKIEV